jgi:quercetin dioxygenase-like cupin family protein
VCTTVRGRHSAHIFESVLTMTQTLTVTPAAQASPFATLADFEAEARRRGFDTVVEREWKPNIVIEDHSHDFHVWARMARGELHLTCEGRTVHLREGDEFTLVAHAPHAERYGEQGASYWVARRAG